MFQFENIQFKRGDKATNDAYVGKPGTISIDRESMNVRVHDGVTPGGIFAITRGGEYDDISAEFIITSDVFTATQGQAVFNLTNVSLDDPSRVKVKINGIQTNNWTVSGVSRITINDAVLLNDTVVVYQYRTIDDAVLTHLNIAMDGITSIGGLNIADIVTVGDVGGNFELAVLEAIRTALASEEGFPEIVNADTFNSTIVNINNRIWALEQYDKTVLTVNDTIDCGIVK